MSANATAEPDHRGRWPRARLADICDPVRIGDESGSGYGGLLHPTSHRLIAIGQVVLIVKLADIVETSTAAERVLIALQRFLEDRA